MIEENKLHQIFITISMFLAKGKETSLSEYTYDIIKTTPKTIRYKEYGGKESVLHKNKLRDTETDWSIRSTHISSFSTWCLTKDRQTAINRLKQRIKDSITDKLKYVNQLQSVMERDLDNI